ncbi:Concanavalin A-like lectin/glucanases superfamily protein [Sphingomonas sp. NFR04]|uniref:LamG-like jellyroll fold domain-containing protein n=1 Tax=Sphingomonas sp. NFR04 TaxID=1566283 RepID=UPI0008E9C86A|nr:LamG-like jellyroll fold domain-containing protein [Sphingomonas sp. NFR04]SFJ65901.1 Concanavalin A-like lectin/glucanases superfamily protein [Sphingomonas sp. NFR04]
MPTRPFASMLALAVGCLSLPAQAQTDPAPGLLFRASADTSLDADVAGGDPAPNFRAHVDVVPDGAIGGAARWADDGYVAWKAPGNMRAARGTLSFFWRAREPLGEVPFVIFRAGFADHTSWDMAFLRIDWNGHGFDAFVTDANLSRIRVSWRIDQLPDPAAWKHIAFAWDETQGVRLYVDGREVARKDQRADLDSGLDQFGLAGRVIAPHQVQSRYSFMRGSDMDEIRVYDRMLSAANIANLAAKAEPGPLPAPDRTAERAAWLHRYGWDKALPPVLDAPVTRVRKIEFADAKDLKEWMWKGVDGIAETTWPGVYNRSRLPGRDDYFELPDWNTYVEGGKRYDLTVPAGERFNRVELRGAAYGTLSWSGDGEDQVLAKRPQGVVRSVDQFAPRTGGILSFTNVMQEQPIQELWAYDIGPGAEPAGSFKLDYTIRADMAPTLAALAPLNAFIAGRYAPDERATVVAMPTAGVKAAVGAGAAGGGGKVARPAGMAPIVHILLPASLGDAPPDQPVARAFDYGWQNIHDGLDGIAIDLPALPGTQPIALDIRVKDPIWPERDMIDLSVTVRPGEKRTLWLDLRDRILSQDSLYLSIAASDPAFSAASLDGARIRLVFKPRAEALTEHVADRLNQVKDNWGFLVEEHTASKRMGLYRRLFADMTDLLRVDPDNKLARTYWADINYRPENMPAFTQPVPQAGEPLWAFRQLEDLRYVRCFVDWWIDERQVPYGDFGGGISDDTDLTQQWPGLALMGIEPDKINASLRALSDAVFANGMRTNGLGTITTDELHAYEEGLNSDAERLYLNWGEPKAVERLMETTRALQGVILKNPAGHLHFASNWYGGRKMYRDAAWAWQKPYSFTVMHAPILIGLYNGNAQARGLVTGVMDGWLAHGRQDASGGWSFPNEINWGTDAERVGDGGGITTPLQSAWSAWRFTGDPKYLRPIEARIAKGGAATLAEFNENAFTALPGGAKLQADIVAAAKADPFSLYARWDATGDTKPLERLHAEAIADKAQHEYLYTEGHWWSDRVEQPNEILQRERLGGIALRRNQTWPGNSVSWRFAEDGAGEQVAILVPGATPDRFRVLAYNRTDRPQRATMTAWNVTAGSWTMQRSTSSDGGTTLVANGAPATLPLERSLGTDLVFAPHTTTIYDFALAAPTTPVEQRPDLGISIDDVVRTAKGFAVTVHSLGAQRVPGGTLMLRATDGGVLANAAIPPLDAPTDLRPRTVVVHIAAPKRPAASVEVALPDNAPEVTRLNNRVVLTQAR